MSHDLEVVVVTVVAMVDLADTHVADMLVVGPEATVIVIQPAARSMWATYGFVTRASADIKLAYTTSWQDLKDLFRGAGILVRLLY